MSKGKKILLLVICLFLCGAVYLVADNVLAEGGSTGGSGGTDAGSNTSACSSWPYKGAINGSNTSLRGVRITVIDNDGKLKAGSRSVDYVKNTGVTSISNVEYSPTKTTKTMYLKYGKILYWSKGTVSFKYDSAIASRIISFFGSGDGSNMGQNIRNLYNAYSNKETWAQNIIQTIYTDTNAGAFTANDVVLFEPITYIKYCNTSGGSVYAYGTAYELNARFTQLSLTVPGWSDWNKAGSYGAVRTHVAKALYFSGDRISSLTDVFREPALPNSVSYPGTVLTGWNGWGMGALWIGELAKSCDINKNNDEDDSYNWTKWDANCDLDADGIKEGCWKKINGGCCDKAIDKYGAATVYSKYPQCADAVCTPQNRKYVNGTPVANLNSVSCNNNSKKLQNYRGVNGLSFNTAKYCLANNQFYTGKTNGKMYGCEVLDELILPKKYSGELNIGEYFVWPTSEKLQKIGVFNDDYPITRKSSLRCVAYSYNNEGKITYHELSDSALHTLETRFDQEGNLGLTFQNKNNGEIIEIDESKDSIAQKNLTDRTIFTITLTTDYTLKEANGTNGVYAYYDQEKLAYTNNIVSSRLSKYVQYGYPIIPYGNYVDGTNVREFNNSISIDYGINYNSIDFSRLNGYSGSYVCRKNDVNTNPQCKCPTGTKNAGMNLTPHFNTGYTSFVSECAVAQNEYCDSNSKYLCPDGADITACVNTKRHGGNTPTEAHNLCIANECAIKEYPDDSVPTDPIDPTDPTDGDIDVIYRPIFLDDPFPSINGSIRTPGANWGGTSSISGGAYDGLVKKYITSTAAQMYQGQPMYSFTITPAGLRQIKSYNETHGYDDFEMDCDDGEYCVSNVLRGSFSSFFTGGTCRGKNEAKRRGSNDCRIDALNY